VTGDSRIGWIQSNDESAWIGNHCVTGVSICPSTMKLEASWSVGRDPERILETRSPLDEGEVGRRIERGRESGRERAGHDAEPRPVVDGLMERVLEGEPLVRGLVVLVGAWRTETEVRIAGFHLARDGKTLNRQLIRAKRSAQPVGAAYRYVDRTARRDRAHTYRLQIIDRRGKRTWHLVGVRLKVR
jgi:hypothetical protein